MIRLVDLFIFLGVFLLSTYTCFLVAIKPAFPNISDEFQRCFTAHLEKERGFVHYVDSSHALNWVVEQINLASYTTFPTHDDTLSGEFRTKEHRARAKGFSVMFVWRKRSSNNHEFVILFTTFKKATFRAFAIFYDFPKNGRLHLNFTKADEEAVCLQDNSIGWKVEWFVRKTIGVKFYDSSALRA